MAQDSEQIQTSGEKAPTHKPVITKTDTGINKFVPGGIRVDVGEVPHGMDPSHYIAWVEVETADGNVTRKDLQPGGKPEATFDIQNPAKVRANCTTHGTWETQV